VQTADKPWHLLRHKVALGLASVRQVQETGRRVSFPGATASSEALRDGETGRK
jgi:hypothetical protein